MLADLEPCAWTVPAEALYEAIAQQGWTIRYGPLPEGTLCVCDAWWKTLNLSGHFAGETAGLKTQQEILHWILAAELGHIRLHGMHILSGKSSPALETTAMEYATAFLLPEEMLRTHPDVIHLLKSLPDTRESWRRMGLIAEFFLVPTACVQSALEHYGMFSVPDASQSEVFTRFREPPRLKRPWLI